MRTKLYILVLLPLSLWAQEPEAVPVGGFTNHGSATVGYRLTDISGRQAKFQELFNLNGGPRLLDLNVFGDAAPGANRFADHYSVTSSGFGGDPFATSQLNVRKNRVFDLRANYRRSYYYWDRDDSAALPVNVSGLTSNHNWATVRKMGSLNLLVHASSNLRFGLEYYRNTRDGVSYVTRTPDYFGSSTVWASYARANPYVMVAPLNESSNRVTGTMDYTRGTWAAHYRIGYQQFESAVNSSVARSGERSINVSDATTVAEFLNGGGWADYRKLTTPVNEFSYTGKVKRNLQLRGGYLFYRYSGPATAAMALDGVARTVSNAATVAPFAVTQASTAKVTEPNHVVDQGFTYQVRPWWDLQVGYRYSRFSVNSIADFRSLNGTVVSTGTTNNQWFVGMSTLDVNMSFSPLPSLLIRPGVRLMKNDVKFIGDDVVDPTRTKRINTAWPTLSAYWEPSRMFTIRADVEQITNGASYTRITPHTDKGGRLVARFRPFEKLYIEQTTIARNRRLIDTDFRSTVRSSATTVTYEFDERYSGFAGFRYDSSFASNFVNFLRGTAPFTNLALRDQTVNRVWQLGVRAKPTPRLELSFTGNYDRTTGSGEIAGEAPLYGPVTFPYATASLAYQVQRVGQLQFMLQRTYYIEQIVPANNFGAKLLTVAWTRSF